MVTSIRRAIAGGDLDRAAEPGGPVIHDWVKQLDFTTKIFRARGLHLDDRHIRFTGGTGFSASIF